METRRLSSLAESGWADQAPHRAADVLSIHFRQRPNLRIYELTRVYGGLTVRPTSYLTAYMQFIDTHALGLPVKHIASNMRDVFDLRQGYLEFRHNNIQLSPASSAATWSCQTSWIPCGLALSVPGGLLEKHSLGKTKIITS